MREISNIKPLGSVNGAVSIDGSAANLFTATLAGAVTFTLSNFQPGQSYILQITQGATAYTITWAGQGTGLTTQASALTTTSIELAGNSNTYSSVLLVGTVTSSGGQGTGDEVLLTSNGSDDTANIAAVLQAGLVARLTPSGSTFFVDGTTMPVLVASNSGGIIGDGEHGVEIRPVASWSPAIGQVDVTTNAFFRLEGAATAGGYTGSSATIQRRGATPPALIGIGSTTGATVGSILECLGSPTGGWTLPEQRCFVKVTAVTSGTVLSIANPLRLNFGSGYNTLPVLLTEITPITRFVCKNVTFNTLGRNIACGFNLNRLYATATGSGSVTTQSSKQIVFDNIRGMGFTRSLINMAGCEGLSISNIYGCGANNCLIFLNGSCHQNEIWNVKTTGTGPAYAPTGVTRTAVWGWGGGSDNYFHDIEIQNMPGAVRHTGGYANKFENIKSFGLQVDIRWTRDTYIPAGSYFGACIDQYVAPGSNEGSYDYQFGDLQCSETYTDAVANPITPTTGVSAYVFVDCYNLRANTLQAFNVGNGTAAYNGVNVDPAGGTKIFDCFYGGLISSISGRNNGGGALLLNLGGFSGIIQSIVYDLAPGISGSPQQPTCIYLGTSGANSCPRIVKVLLSNGGTPFDFNGTYAAGIDYNMVLDEVVNQGSGTVFRHVVPSLNAGPITYFAADVAAMDSTSATGTRRIIEATADIAAPVIVAQNSNSGIAFIALRGGSVLTAGAATPVDLLTAQGGANHRAKVNNAATFGTVLGRPALALGATNTINECIKL